MPLNGLVYFTSFSNTGPRWKIDIYFGRFSFTFKHIVFVIIFVTQKCIDFTCQYPTPVSFIFRQYEADHYEFFGKKHLKYTRNFTTCTEPSRHGHYSDVIMGTMASQITSLTIVYWTEIKENIKAPRHWPLCGEFTGEFPAQRAGNAEYVYIWWRHHGTGKNNLPHFTPFWGLMTHISFLIMTCPLLGANPVTPTNAHLLSTNFSVITLTS